MSGTRLASLTLAVAMVLSAVGTFGVSAAPAAANHDSGQGGSQSFAFAQPDRCYEVGPHGNGSESAAEFYDYSIYSDYSSTGTTHLQDNQVSNVFVYEGADGYSLVFLHDEYATTPYGATVTMGVSGLPADGEWVVRDDSYDDGDQDDRWQVESTRAEIDWMWAPGRTDGGVFRGLGTDEGTTVVVDPAFNEKADAWDEWTYAGGDHRVETWRVPDEDGTALVDLSMDDRLTVSPGSCDTDPPSAAVTVESSVVEPNASVTLDASASTADGSVVSYRWDLTGDGKTDRTTSGPTVTHAYDEPASYDVTVEVVDRVWNVDAASATVNVTDGSPPTADVDAPAEVPVDEPFTAAVTNVTNQDRLASITWYVDGEVAGDGETVTVTPSEVGAIDVIAQLEDTVGETHNETATVSVVGSEDDGQDGNDGSDGDDGQDGGDGDDGGDGQNGDDGDSDDEDDSDRDDPDDSDSGDDNSGGSGGGGGGTGGGSVTPLSYTDSDDEGDADSNATVAPNVTAVETDAATVEPGADLNVTVTVEGNRSYDDPWVNVTVAESTPDADHGPTVETLNVTVPENETTVTATTTLEDASEYVILAGDHDASVAVEQRDRPTPTPPPTPASSPTETATDRGTATSTATTTPSDGPANEGTPEATALGPGFTPLAAVLALLVLALAASRRR